jgi:hypothetical protein
MPQVTKDTTFAQFDKAQSAAGTKKRRGPAQSMRFEKAAEGPGFVSHTEHKDMSPNSPNGYGMTHVGPVPHGSVEELHTHIDKMFGGKKPKAKAAAEPAGKTDHDADDKA